MTRRGLLAALAACLCATSASARWKPEYASVPPEVRAWYETRELTPAAQKRIGFKSCCAHSDVVRTKFKVSGAGNDEWWWEKDATWVRVPADIIHWGEPTPTGEPILFAFQGLPTCFFPGQSGI